MRNFWSWTIIGKKALHFNVFSFRKENLRQSLSRLMGKFEAYL